MKVLYVEDDLRDADVTLRTLRKLAPAFDVEIAPTIEVASSRLSKVATNPIDVVLTDMHLRDGDGLALLRQIRENGIPVAVVVITGMGDEETAVTALKERADDYVVKRKDYLDRLPTILESALTHFRAETARRTHSLNIVYVDDNQNDVDSTRRHFAIHADHLRIQDVATANEALYLLREPVNRAYHMLLMSFELPELKALEVLHQLRSPLSQPIPVVVVCTPENEMLASQCLARGATSVVVKRPGYLHQLPWEIEEAYSRSELERRESALQESEERLRLAQQAARVGTWEWHLTTGTSVWSDMLWEVLGFERNGEPPSLEQFMEFVHPDDREQTLSHIDEVIRNGEDYDDEFRIITQAGNIRWISAKGRLFRSDDGTPERIIGVTMDINERRLTENSLKNALLEVEQLKDKLHRENIYLQEEIRVASNIGEIIGESTALRQVLQLAEQVAPLETTVLILGETGTGKELLAHAIHRLSPRHNRTLVKVNCAALPSPLIESELFGHAKGAFTGADVARTGRFEIANGGTIFLDEVGELPLDLQVKLLRVLQEGEFERVGDSRTISVDVRVIAATNRDLAEEVRQNRFRSDLYYRLNIFPITLPPLRERQKDIPILVRHFVEELSRKLGKKIDSVPQETMAHLRNYPWPGNIRELRNVLERAVIVTNGPTLQVMENFSGVRLDGDTNTRTEVDLDSETLDSSQYNLILRTLKKTHWRIEGVYGAAAALNINPSTLRTRMKKLGITKPGGASQSRP